MKELLNKCRPYNNTEKNKRRDIISTAFVLLLGLTSGIAAKLIDEASFNDEILWQRFLDTIDLRNILSRLAIWALAALCLTVYSKRPLRASINVFTFFATMMAGYYTITITVSGFYPKSYMIAWGTITLFTPLLAYFAWYAKGRGWLAVVLSSITISFFIAESLSYGRWYFHISYYPEFIFLIIASTILFRNIKQFIIVIVGAFIITPFIESCISHIFGGL